MLRRTIPHLSLTTLFCCTLILTSLFSFVLAQSKYPKTVSVLEAAGHRDLPDGAAVECEISQGAKGPTVTTIFSVTAPEGGGDGEIDVEPEGPMIEGVVKFFDANKGYGFVVPDDGGPDIFISGRVVASSGLRMLEPETRVRVGTQKGDKGPLAVKVELV